MPLPPNTPEPQEGSIAPANLDNNSIINSAAVNGIDVSVDDGDPLFTFIFTRPVTTIYYNDLMFFAQVDAGGFAEHETFVYRTQLDVITVYCERGRSGDANHRRLERRLQIPFCYNIDRARSAWTGEKVLCVIVPRNYF